MYKKHSWKVGDCIHMIEISDDGTLRQETKTYKIVYCSETMVIMNNMETAQQFIVSRQSIR
jgi:hypothetical protein